MVGSGPPARRWRPATFCLAEVIAGPEEREQEIEVDERVEVEERVTRAEEGSDLYWDFRGAWVARRVGASIVRTGVGDVAGKS